MPGGVGNREHRSCARPGQIVDWYLLLLKHAQNSEVGDAPREASAQRDTDARPLPRERRGLRVGEFADTLHGVLKPVEDLLWIAVSHRWD